VSAHAIDTSRVLSADNISLSANAGSGLSKGLISLGLLACALALVGAFAGSANDARIALHALHTGFLYALLLPITAMAFVMFLHVTKAGWSATIRRQFENLMSLMWLPAIMFVVLLLLQLVLSGRGEGAAAAYLWKWMNPAYVAGDAIYDEKAAYLTVPFFLIRAVLIFGVLLTLSFLLWDQSTRQDSDGDKWHTTTALKIAAGGLPFFAFATAFGGFDWLMTLDYHWFSTMLGVHFFAGGLVTALATGTLTLLILRSLGRLHSCFTEEHMHDITKLLFGFTVFWAYISFSQYFLIWYANIPEETWFFQIRKEGAWQWTSWALPIAHFAIPFIVLLPRPMRRNGFVVGAVCVWLLLAQVFETYWMVRPNAMLMTMDEGTLVKQAAPLFTWIDLVGVLGPILIFAGFYIRKVASGPLVAINDPRMPEALRHTNHI
jgi:hypothetical protein